MKNIKVFYILAQFRMEIESLNFCVDWHIIKFVLKTLNFAIIQTKYICNSKVLAKRNLKTCGLIDLTQLNRIKYDFSNLW